MAKVILKSWREGLEKVSLTKLQMDKLGMSLKQSKLNVDFLLDDKKIIIEIDNTNLAKEFFEEAERIGVNCEFIDNYEN